MSVRQEVRKIRRNLTITQKSTIDLSPCSSKRPVHWVLILRHRLERLRLELRWLRGSVAAVTSTSCPGGACCLTGAEGCWCLRYTPRLTLLSRLQLSKLLLVGGLVGGVWKLLLRVLRVLLRPCW